MKEENRRETNTAGVAWKWKDKQDVKVGLSSGLQRRVDWCKYTNVSEVCTASIIRAKSETSARSLADSSS
jgi:hypothetical protein